MYLIPKSGQVEKKRFKWGEKLKTKTQRHAVVSPVAATCCAQSRRRGKWIRKPKRVADKQQQHPIEYKDKRNSKKREEEKETNYFEHKCI